MSKSEIKKLVKPLVSNNDNISSKSKTENINLKQNTTIDSDKNIQQNFSPVCFSESEEIRDEYKLKP